ncbi:hypothetical protein J3F84DRAFT_354316 [Trichoderma pleuroticola]
MTAIGEGKGEQKFSTIRLGDPACMTKREATRHEKEIFKADKSSEELYDEETIQRIGGRSRTVWMVPQIEWE